MQDTVAAPTDTQQSGSATYSGRHRDPWDRPAASKAHEPPRDLMPSGDTADDWHAAGGANRDEINRRRREARTTQRSA